MNMNKAARTEQCMTTVHLYPRLNRKDINYMSIKFPSDEWIKELCARLNASETYAQAAANWEGDIYLYHPAGCQLSAYNLLLYQSPAW